MTALPHSLPNAWRGLALAVMTASSAGAQELPTSSKQLGCGDVVATMQAEAQTGRLSPPSLMVLFFVEGAAAATLKEGADDFFVQAVLRLFLDTCARNPHLTAFEAMTISLPRP